MAKIAPALLTLALSLLVVAPAAPSSEGKDLPVDLLSSAAYYAFTRPPPPLPGTEEVAVLGPALDVNVSPYAQAQNEPALAVSPKDPNFLVAAWNDYLYSPVNKPFVWNGAGVSHDGGLTWSSGLMSPSPHDRTWPATQPPLRSYALAGDPIAAINGEGTAVVGMLMFGGAGPSGIWMQSYSAAGDALAPLTRPLQDPHGVPDLTFGTLQVEASAGGPGGFTDKPWMAADPDGSEFYMAWTDFNQGSQIWLAASHDGLGLVWEKPIRISQGDATFVQGSDIWVGPDHEVYVAYVSLDAGSLTGATRVRITKSLDRGDTWTAPVTVATTSNLALPNAAFRNAIFPHVAVNPLNGEVYIVWAQGTGNVLFTRSADGGATWSTPADVFPNANAQFMPDIATGPDGTIAVGFYDRSADPANRFSRYSLVTSTDAGATWTAPAAVQSAVNDGLVPKWFFIGDYTTVAIGSDGKVHAVWTDTSGASQDIHTSA